MPDDSVSKRAKDRDREIELFTTKLKAFLDTRLAKILNRVRIGDIPALEAASQLGGILQGMKDLGLDAQLAELDNIYTKELLAVKSELDALSTATGLGTLVFSDADKSVVEALISADYSQIEGKIGAYITDVKAAVFRSVVAQDAPDYDAVIERFGPRMAANMETELRTGLSAFNQTVTNHKLEQSGIEYVEYLGPDDKVTRDFCRNLLHKGGIFKLSEVKRMQNDQGTDAYIYRGGYNCRHQWRGLDSDTAKSRLSK